METARPTLGPEALLTHSAFVRSIARGLLLDEHLADDATQQTWLAAIERPPRADATLKSWLASVARNFALQIRRERWRRARREERAPRRDPLPSTAEIVEREAVRRRVVEAVLALDEPYRAVVLYRFYEELSLPEVAAQLGVPLETARTRLRRGLEKLRARLDSEHGGDRRAWSLALAPFAAKPAIAAPATTSPLAPFAVLSGALVMKLALKVGIAAIVVIGAGVALWPRANAPGSATGAATGGSAPLARVAAGAAPAGVESSADTTTARGEAAIDGPRATGRVVDAEGKPVAGAAVVSYPGDLKKNLRLQGGDAPASVRRATSSTDGRFAIALEGRSPFFTIRADKPGLSPGWTLQVRPSDDATVTLPRPVAVSGRVMDADGNPIAGARVSWLAVIGGTFVELGVASKANGDYRIEGIPTGWSHARGNRPPDWWMEADADGFALVSWQKQRLTSPPPDADLELDLILVRGATVHGRVVDAETNAPIAGAPVALWSIQSGRWGPERPKQIGETKSTADGTFLFEHAPSKGFHPTTSSYGGTRQRGEVLAYIAARPTGYAPNTDELNEHADGATVESTIRCWPAASIRGRVVDERGAPRAGIQVGIYPVVRDKDWFWVPYFADGWDGSWPTTGADGGYVGTELCALRGAASGVDVQANVPGNEWVGQTRPEPWYGHHLSLRAGEPVDAPDLVVPDAALQSRQPGALVTVVDVAGKPVWGAVVNPSDYVFRGESKTTDERGEVRFTFDGYADTTKPRRLFASAPGFAKAASDPFLASAAAPPPIRFVLGPGHRIAGRVLRADGAPAAGIDVRVFHPLVSVVDAFPKDVYAEPNAALPQPVIYGHTKSGPDGRFVVKDLPDGPYNAAALRDWRIVAASIAGVSADASDVVLTLAPEPAPPPSSPLEGTVRDASTGKGLVDFSVVLRRDEQRVVAERPGLGRFRWESVPHGEWKLTLQAPDYVEIRDLAIRVGPGGATPRLDLTLDRGAVVRGTVRWPAGFRSGMTAIVFKRDGSAPFEQVRATVTSDGAFRALGLRPGRYRTDVFVESDRRLVLSPFQLVVPEGARDVTFDATASNAEPLVVNVKSPRLPPRYGDETPPTDDQRRAAAESKVTIVDAAGQTAWWGSVDRSDGACFPALVPGGYVIRVVLPGAPAKEQRVTIESGKRDAITIEIE